MEYTKYYLEKSCRDAGVEVMYYTLAADVQVEEDSIKSILLAAESGCFTARARNYIDATGNGLTAKLAGCRTGLITIFKNITVFYLQI